MNNKTVSVSAGVSGVELLAIAFVVLKLCGVMTWSWWWVLAPLWALPALLLAALAFAAIVGLIRRIFDL